MGLLFFLSLLLWCAGKSLREREREKQRWVGYKTNDKPYKKKREATISDAILAQCFILPQLTFAISFHTKIFNKYISISTPNKYIITTSLHIYVYLLLHTFKMLRFSNFGYLTCLFFYIFRAFHYNYNYNFSLKLFYINQEK